MSTPCDRISETVFQVVREQVPSEACADLAGDTRLFDVGLDSMKTIAIVVALEERLGCRFEIDDLELETFATVDTITSVVRAKAALNG